MSQASKFLFLIALLFLGVFSRWIPHPWNFTAVGATALLAGSALRLPSFSISMPIMILFLSDLILGMHSLTVYVYGAFLLTVLLGRLIKEKNYFAKSQLFKISGLSLTSSFLFFLITNLGVWLSQGMYPRTTEGLIECYVMALPFLKNQILGDLFFSLLLFSVYEVCGRRWLSGQVHTT